MSASNQRPVASRKVLILTALPVEFGAVQQHLAEPREDVHPMGTVYLRGHFNGESGSWAVLLAEVGAGNVDTAYEVERAIRHFQPEVALFVGVAGGLKDVSIGDVVVATKVYNYESGKEALEFEPRPQAGESTYRLRQRALATARNGNWKHRIQGQPPHMQPRALTGPLAAGEKVLANTKSDLYQRLRKQYSDALAVEMEGWGFLAAVRANPGVEALVIRGISDCIDGKAAADTAGSQEQASRHASAFAFELLARYTLPARDSEPEQHKRVWMAHYPRNPNFTGRSVQLEAIRTHFLAVPARPVPLALHGLGGVGKTQLAVEYAARYALDTSNYSHVLWVQADDPSVLSTSFAALAETLSLPEEVELEPSKKMSRKIEAIRRWLQQHEEWLLVFDNAQHPHQLRPYLPLAARGNILITSRNPVWSELAAPYPIEVLTPDEASAFLRRRTGQDDESAASALSDALGHLPLALTQAAAYIEQTQKSLADYLALFERRRHEMLSRPGAPADYPYTVAATWELSFKEIHAQSPGGAALLAFCACLAPSPISTSLLAMGAEHLPAPLKNIAQDELLLDEAIGALRKYSFVQSISGELLFHRLVQMVMLNHLAEERGQWVEAALRLVLNFFDGNDDSRESWSQSAALLPHALAASENARRLGIGGEALTEILWRLGCFLESQAEYEQARMAFIWGLNQVRSEHGPECPAEARFLMELGEVAKGLGKIEEATEYLQHALRLVTAAPTESSQWPNEGSICNDLARVLADAGQFKEAQTYAERAVAQQETSGRNPRGLSVFLETLGSVLLSRARFEEAKECFERSSAIIEAQFGPQDPVFSGSLHNRARLLERMGRYGEALPVAERALVISEAARGSEHPVVAIMLNTLGLLHQKAGNLAEARDCCSRALRINEARLGSVHPEVARSLNNLALVLHEMGNLETARTHFERALSLEEQLYGQEHVRLAPILNNLGRILGEQRELVQARSKFERALVIQERELGSAHPEVGTVCTNLGMLLKSAGDLPEACRYLERALAIDEAAYGPLHPEVATDLSNLGHAFIEIGDLRHGRQMLERAVAIYDAQKPLPIARLLPPLGRLAMLDFEAMDWLTARVRLERAVQFQEQLASDAPEALALRLKLGFTLLNLGEPEQTLESLERVKGAPAITLNEKLHLEMLACLGAALRMVDNRQEARARLEEAVSLAEKLGERDLLVFIYAELGRLLRDENELELARHFLEQALKIHGEVALATSYVLHRDLGLLLEQQEKLVDAHSHLGHALEACERLQGAESLNTAAITMHLGRVILRLGKAALAIQHLLRALNIYQQHENPNPARLFETFTWLAQARLKCHQKSSAKRAAEKAAALVGTFLSPKNPIIADMLPVLRGVLSRTGSRMKV